jgi:hypothetical protein
MSAEEELKQFKKDSLKRARQTAIIFSVCATAALIALTYAFFQNAATQRTAMQVKAESVECVKLVEERDKQILKLQSDLEKQIIMTENALKEAERQYQAARKRDSK